MGTGHSWCYVSCVWAEVSFVIGRQTHTHRCPHYGDTGTHHASWGTCIHSCLIHPRLGPTASVLMYVTLAVPWGWWNKFKSRKIFSFFFSVYSFIYFIHLFDRYLLSIYYSWVGNIAKELLQEGTGTNIRGCEGGGTLTVAGGLLL